MDALLSVRRILTAGLLAILLGAGSIAVVGTASAQEPSFALPARHAGDEVQYRSSFDGESPQDVGRFEQLQMSVWKDADGNHRVADGVVERVSSNGFEAPVFSFVDLEGQPIAATTSFGLASGSVETSQGSETTRTYVGRLALGASNHPCGFVNSLQGTPASEELVAFCPDQNASKFQLIGKRPWNDGEVAVFRGPGVELWFQPEIPYPVRIETDDAWMEMQGFRRGHEPLAAPLLPAAAPLPEVRSAARPELAVDFSGLGHDYPLQQAIDEAMLDPTFPDLREFVLAHPDAQVVAAEHIREEHKQIWGIQWADDSAHLRVVIERQRTYPGIMAYDVLGADAGWFVDRSGYAANIGHDVCLPDRAPPVRDVAAAWASYVGSDEPPRVVGFALSWLGCRLDVYAGAQGGMTVQNQGIADLGAPPAEDVDEEGKTLHYDEHGKLLGIDMTKRMESRSGQMPPLGAAAVVPELYTSSGWALPGPRAAAGVGLGALLAGLAYWAWPLAKGIPLAGLRWRRPPAPNPRREMVRRAVVGAPGIHYHDIVRVTGLGKGTVEHHLRRLEEDGAIQCSRSDGYTCYFPGGTDRRATAAASVMKSLGARQVLAAIREHPGAAVTEVATLTGLSPGTVSHHLRRLRQRGVVESWRDGRTVRLKTSPLEATLASTPRPASGARHAPRPPPPSPALV